MSLVGRLEDLALPDIFQIISLSKKTGTLVVRSRKGTGMVVFKNGQVVQAGSDVIRDSLGNILVSQGMVAQADLAAALARQKTSPDKPLGMLLVETGVTTAQVIEDVVRQQIEEIIYDLLAWEEGFFNFELGEVSPKDKIEIDTQNLLLRSGLSAEYLLMEGTRILDEKRKGQAQGKKAAAPPKAQAAPKPPVPIDPFAAAAAAAPPRPASALSRPAPVTRTSSEPARQEFRTKIETESPSKQITTLKSMFDELRFPTATAEVTLLTLRYASEVVNRAILFMVKKDEVRGLGQFGIELKEGSADQRIRKVKIPTGESSIFSDVLTEKRSRVGRFSDNAWDTYLIGELGGAEPREYFLIPLISNGKVAAVLYGDNLPDNRPIPSLAALEIFIHQAGLAMEKALLERRLADMEKQQAKN